jgi:hypothetical protein
MNALIFAVGAWSVGQMAIAAIIVAAVVGIVYVAFRQMGVAIPPWVIQVVWILIVAIVCILAIKFLVGLF